MVKANKKSLRKQPSKVKLPIILNTIIKKMQGVARHDHSHQYHPIRGPAIQFIDA